MLQLILYKKKKKKERERERKRENLIMVPSFQDVAWKIRVRTSKFYVSIDKMNPVSIQMPPYLDMRYLNVYQIGGVAIFCRAMLCSVMSDFLQPHGL